MLTRLEVSGFKNLRDVRLDLGPFTCIAGENGVGKSNVFDVIEFMSSLADASFGEAAQDVRGSAGLRYGNVRDIFWNGIAGASVGEISLAAEMLVPVEVEDDLGSSARATTTFLRYELRLAFEGNGNDGSSGRIALRHESLTHITKGQARQHLPFPHARTFRDEVVQGQRRGGDFLSTSTRDGSLVVNVHGDGGSFGRPQPRAAERSNRTILSTMTTNDNPTALAARREMQSWRRLSLEPSAMRAPDGFSSPQVMSPDGAHIASTLWRIAHTPDASGEIVPESVYARIADRLSDLLGARVNEVLVDRDQVREVFTLYLDEGGGHQLPARALSEGTLRFLALCVLLEDPTSKGLICMEEPENGIHPSNLAAIIELVKDLAVDPDRAPDESNPFRQVVVNTHSPGVVQLCDENDLVVARIPQHDRGAQLYGYEGSWRARAGAATFSKLDALPYLTPPKGVQFELPLELHVS